VLATSACMGDDGGARITLTGDDCAYDGPEVIEAGTRSFEIENQTDDAGIFDLVQIEPGSGDQLQAYVREEQQRIDDGLAARGVPDFATVVIGLEVDPGDESFLTSALSNTAYAIVCSSGTPPTDVHIGTVFDAT
jgi:hypothetical protein